MLLRGWYFGCAAIGLQWLPLRNAPVFESDSTDVAHY